MTTGTYLANLSSLDVGSAKLHLMNIYYKANCPELGCSGGIFVVVKKEPTYKIKIIPGVYKISLMPKNYKIVYNNKQYVVKYSNTTNIIKGCNI